MVIAGTSVWIEFLKNNQPTFSLFEEGGKCGKQKVSLS